MSAPTRSQAVAGSIEYTDLRKTISERAVETMCAEALLCGFAAVVVPSALVPLARGCIDAGSPSVATVVSYPFGTQGSLVKAREAEAAVDGGACELDVVPHFGAILAERWDSVRTELSEVRAAAGEATLKLVLEVARLTSTQIREACAIAAGEGFDFVVNTVGFRLVSTDPNAEGSASAEVLTSLRALADDRLKLKAAGGIDSIDLAAALLVAGAERISVAVAPGRLRTMGLLGAAGGGVQ